MGKQYCLRCKSGVANKCYSASDLESYPGSFNILVEGGEMAPKVSL